MQRYLSGLLLAITLLSLLPFPSLSRSVQGTLLGTEIYLKATNSSIPGFKTVSLVKPTGSINNAISVNASASGSYLLASWITPWVFASMNINSQYTFYFEMYGNGSGLAKFQGEVLLYRGGSLISIFNSSLSAPLSTDPSNALMWQSLTPQNIIISSGDRIAFRLHLIADPGNYSFFYDSVSFPSYLADPTEIRYFTNELPWTVNTCSSWQLLTAQSSTPGYWEETTEGIGILTGTWGIKVYRVQPDGTKTVLSGALPVATVSRSLAGGGIQSATWSLSPSVTLGEHDSIMVCTWFKLSIIIPWTNEGDWSTEQLGAQTLNASTWTVYYYTQISLRGTTYSYMFRYGSSIYDSRITNFIWTKEQNPPTYILPFPSYSSTYAGSSCMFSCEWLDMTGISGYVFQTNNTGTYLNDTWVSSGGGKDVWENITKTLNSTVGLVIGYRWYSNDTDSITHWNSTSIQYLTTTPYKTWNFITYWTFNLITRSWILVAFWSFDLVARIWNPISSWILSLNVRSWQNINFWILTLRSPEWNSVSSWTFELATLGWYSIAFWIFLLTPFSTGFLLIPLIFLVGVVLFLMAVALGKKFQNEF